jgi:hypothetical protein
MKQVGPFRFGLCSRVPAPSPCLLRVFRLLPSAPYTNTACGHSVCSRCVAVPHSSLQHFYFLYISPSSPYSSCCYYWSLFSRLIHLFMYAFCPFLSLSFPLRFYFSFLPSIIALSISLDPYQFFAFFLSPPLFCLLSLYRCCHLPQFLVPTFCSRPVCLLSLCAR